ncbi:MAG: hypothetical protein ACRC8P_03980 [Spiroplasma sp.]
MNKNDDINSAKQLAQLMKWEKSQKTMDNVKKNIDDYNAKQHRASQIKEQKNQAKEIKQINNKLENLEIEKKSFDFFYEKFIKSCKDNFETAITSYDNSKLNFLINHYQLIECNKDSMSFINSDKLENENRLVETELRITDKGRKFREYILQHQMENQLLEAYKSFSKNETNLPVNSKWIFIGMSYNENFSERERMITEAIEEMGFEPKLAKTTIKPSNFTIDSKMIELMNQSKYGIFDISHVKDNYPNIGAVYEGGYMDGAGKELIMICKDTDINKLHFDLRNKDILKFDTETNLKEKLKERIQKLWLS